MFLKVFNQEDRSNFLELASFVAHCDGNYSEEEEKIINNYKIELEMNEIPNNGKTLSDLITYFAGRTEMIRKVVLFEIYGLILADSKTADKEQEILNQFDSEFQLSTQNKKIIKSLVVKLQNVYDEIYDTLF